MPVRVQFYDGVRLLSPAAALTWAASAGHRLHLHTGEGLALSEFLARKSKNYGFLEQDDFVRELGVFANQGRAVGRGPLPQPAREDPSTLGVHMGEPNPQVAVHAHHRVERQLRILGFVFLLRQTGAIPRAANVTLALTTLQHGRGGAGQAAAHKVIAVPAFGGTALYEVPADMAVRTALVFLVSETSVIPAACNDADREIEAILREPILGVVRIILAENDDVLSLNRFSERMAALWNTLRDSYVSACKNARLTVWDRVKKECKNYKSRLLLDAAAEVGIIVEKALEAKRNAAKASLIAIVLDEYREKALTMPFPLTRGELENMYNLVMSGTAPGARPGFGCASVAQPSSNGNPAAASSSPSTSPRHPGGHSCSAR